MSSSSCSLAPSALPAAASVDSSPDSLRVCIVGAPGVGKSALAVRLLTNRFITSYMPSSPTLTTSRHVSLPSTPNTSPRHAKKGVNNHAARQQQQQQLHLTVRDVSSSSRPLLAPHLDWCQCLVVVMVRGEEDTFRQAADILERRRNSAPDLPAILVANKADLLLSPPSPPVVSLDACHELALEHGVLFLEMSAMESPAGTRMLLVLLLSELIKQQQGRKAGASSSAVAKGARSPSRKALIKVFGSLCKSLCSHGGQQT